MKTKTKNPWRVAAIAVACLAALFAVLFWWATQKLERSQDRPVFSDEMKLPYAYDYKDQGAAAFERVGDHPGSPYFYSADFYNLQSTDTLTILPQFKTYQQTSWWSCGVAAELMVLDYYDRLGDWNEENLAALCADHSDIHPGRCLDQLVEMLEGSGQWEIESTYDYQDNLDAIDLPFIQSKLQEGSPILVGWNDWGGHWAVIIGYDEMDTPDFVGDDVLIMADSFDTTDHNQDGYGVYGAERFIYNFSFYDFFGDDAHLRDKCFIVAKPVA